MPEAEQISRAAGILAAGQAPYAAISLPQVDKIQIGRVKGEEGVLVAKIGNQFAALDFTEGRWRGPRGWQQMLETPELFPKVIDAYARGALRVVEMPKESDFLRPMLDDQLVWGAGVTYENSMRARRIEALGSGNEVKDGNNQLTGYDKVYSSDGNASVLGPDGTSSVALGGSAEVFFKGFAGHVSLDVIGVRGDRPNNITPVRNLPEPELVIFVNSKNQIAGYSLGSDTTANFFEASSELRLPQAKTYPNCMTVQRMMTVLNPESVPLNERGWPEADIRMRIYRGRQCMTDGITSTKNLARPASQILETLLRMAPNYDTGWPNGNLISTGTGIIPDNFTLNDRDTVVISSPLLGVLQANVEVIRYPGNSQTYFS